MTNTAPRKSLAFKTKSATLKAQLAQHRLARDANTGTLDLAQELDVAAKAMEDALEDLRLVANKLRFNVVHAREAAHAGRKKKT